MNTRVIPSIEINRARRCRTVLLAQLYYAVRGLLFCCGVLFAFLGFFGAEGAFESLPVELFADSCKRFCVSRSLTSLLAFETTSFSDLNVQLKHNCFSLFRRNDLNFERAISKRPNTVKCLAVKCTLLGTRHLRKEKEAALQNEIVEPACLCGEISVDNLIF